VSGIRNLVFPEKYVCPIRIVKAFGRRTLSDTGAGSGKTGGDGIGRERKVTTYQQRSLESSAE